MLRFLILGLLRDGTPRHGYALMKAYRDASGFRVNVGNYYRELPRLVVAGWVSPVTNPPGADPRRTPYRITDAGRAALEAWLGHAGEADAAEHQDDVALRTYLITQIGGRAALACFERWRDELALRRRLCERACASAGGASVSGEGTFSPRRLMLARRLQQAALDLEFVEQFGAAYRTVLVKSPRRDRPEPVPPTATGRRPMTPPLTPPQSAA